MRLFNLFSKPPRLRPVTVRPDDVFIVSYPKSGNTWQRFLVANLVRPDLEITFATVESVVPDVHQAEEADLEKRPSPRFLKSHEAFTPRYPRTIYITRDPRSVAISMYHFMIGHGKLRPDHPMDDFLRGYVKGVHFRKFRSWGDNVMSWVSQVDQGQATILLLRYEDLKSEPLVQLRRVADFLKIPASEADLQRAVENSSFRRMQSLDDEMNRTNPAKKWDPTRRFIRKGETDEWKQVFTPEQTEMIGRAFAEPMRRMRYL